jgi:hypothetical protein
VADLEEQEALELVGLASKTDDPLNIVEDTRRAAAGGRRERQKSTFLSGLIAWPGNLPRSDGNLRTRSSKSALQAVNQG